MKTGEGYLLDGCRAWTCELVVTGIAEAQKEVNRMDDLISRQAAIDALDMIGSVDTDADREYAREVFMSLPSAQPEQLTDKEQRIFLAAMAREEKVCEEVDRNHIREPYEDSLMRVCKEIRRKVKGALWT